MRQFWLAVIGLRIFLRATDMVDKLAKAFFVAVCVAFLVVFVLSLAGCNSAVMDGRGVHLY